MAAGEPADYATPLYPQKLVLSSPTSRGHSVGIVHSWTEAMEFFCLFVFFLFYSSVDVVARYGLDLLGLIPGSARFSSSLQCPDQLQSPSSLLSKGIRGLFPGGKGVELQGCVANHSPPSSAKVKKCGAIPRCPHKSSWHSAYLIKQMDNFTFYVRWG
jgi:hypothetical protein